MATTVESDSTFSPSSVLGIFVNTLNNEVTRKLLKIKGVYVQGKGTPYGGYYYDHLKDEYQECSMTLIVPGLIRSSLTPDKTIEFVVYVSKKIQNLGGRVELQLNVVDVLAQHESKYNDEQIQGFEMLQRKAEHGYKDVDSFIKTKIIKAEPIRINIITGRNAIVDSDIKHQLGESIGFYHFNFLRFNLATVNDVAAALKEAESDCDILVIARGGGSNLEVFNKASLAEIAVGIKPYFVTAIGHEQDVTLLQKVADKLFITPTALGQYFNQLYNTTIEQLQGSKAKLVAEITEQLKVNYDKQVSNLHEKIHSLEQLNNKNKLQQDELNNQKLTMLNSQLQDLKNNNERTLKELSREQEAKSKVMIEIDQLRKSVNSPNMITWITAIAAIVLGVLIGKGC